MKNNKSVKVVQFSPVIRPKKSEDLSGEDEEYPTSDRSDSPDGKKKKKKTLPPKMIIKPRKSIRSKTHISLTSVDDNKKKKESKESRK